MKAFIFNGKVENQIKGFNQFVKNLKEINSAIINFHFGKEIALAALRTEIEKISKIIGKNTEVKFAIKTDKICKTMNIE